MERYRYLLRTAPPETIEQVHAEAFSRLTESQRALLYEELSRGAGTGERPLSSEPATLARAATRREMRNPGALEQTLTGPSFASIVGGSLLGTVAGYVIGSTLVSAFLPWDSGVTGMVDAAGPDAGMSGEGADFDAEVDGNFAAGLSGDLGADLGGDFGF